MKVEVNADKRNQVYYQETFQEVHASEALAGKVRNMADSAKRKTKISRMTYVKKFAVTTAALAILLAGSNVVAYAATGSTWIVGMFRDITGFGGVVTGTEYVQATEEVDIFVDTPAVQDGMVLLPLEIVFKNQEKAPFRYMEEVAVTDVKVLDVSGASMDVTLNVPDGNTSAVVVDGTVQFPLQISGEGLKPGDEYILVIESFYGLSKADAPLEIKGHWECKFTMKMK